MGGYIASPSCRNRMAVSMGTFPTAVPDFFVMRECTAAKSAEMTLSRQYFRNLPCLLSLAFFSRPLEPLDWRVLNRIVAPHERDRGQIPARGPACGICARSCWRSLQVSTLCRRSSWDWRRIQAGYIILTFGCGVDRRCAMHLRGGRRRFCWITGCSSRPCCIAIVRAFYGVIFLSVSGVFV